MADTDERPIVPRTQGVWSHGLWGASSDAGLVRQANEDAWGQRADFGLWVIADGVGGHLAGELASAMAVETVLERAAGGSEDVAAILLEAHKRILLGQEHPESAGMGTTVVVARLSGDRCEIAWVGDSRAYLLRGGTLYPLTTDHSYVSMLVKKGALSPEEALTHPNRNIILKALGIQGFDSADTVNVGLSAGDRLLLCTDGLTSMVPEQRITAILDGRRDPGATAEDLVREANLNGGHDNTTVVLIDVARSDPSSAPWEDIDTSPRQTTVTGKRRHGWHVYLLIALLIIFVAIIAIVVAQSGGKKDQPARPPKAESILQKKTTGGIER